MEKVVIKLSNGKQIRCELYPDVAPITVANFLKLVDQKFYDGIIFHRVIANFMIQTGGHTFENGRLVQRPADNIKGEFLSNGVKNDLSHVPGVLSMARANDKNSGSSQFFICVADCKYLDGNYAAFGKVSDEESLQAAIEISKVKTTSIGYYDDVPVQPISIVTIERA